MHTYGCIDIHMPRHLVHAYAGICINTHTCAYIWEHMYTNACVRAYVCICTCISALGRGGEQPKNLTPPLGGGALGLGPHAYIYTHFDTFSRYFHALSSLLLPAVPRPLSGLPGREAYSIGSNNYSLGDQCNPPLVGNIEYPISRNGPFHILNK